MRRKSVRMGKAASQDLSRREGEEPRECEVQVGGSMTRRDWLDKTLADGKAARKDACGSPPSAEAPE